MVSSSIGAFAPQYHSGNDVMKEASHG